MKDHKYSKGISANSLVSISIKLKYLYKGDIKTKINSTINSRFSFRKNKENKEK